eukprot:4758764-Pyramimonas_sp.AAC.2
MCMLSENCSSTHDQKRTTSIPTPHRDTDAMHKLGNAARNIKRDKGPASERIGSRVRTWMRGVRRGWCFTSGTGDAIPALHLPGDVIPASPSPPTSCAGCGRPCFAMLDSSTRPASMLGHKYVIEHSEVVYEGDVGLLHYNLALNRAIVLSHQYERSLDPQQPSSNSMRKAMSLPEVYEACAFQR